MRVSFSWTEKLWATLKKKKPWRLTNVSIDEWIQGKGKVGTLQAQQQIDQFFTFFSQNWLLVKQKVTFALYSVWPKRANEPGKEH